MVFAVLAAAPLAATAIGAARVDNSADATSSSAAVTDTPASPAESAMARRIDELLAARLARRRRRTRRRRRRRRISPPGVARSHRRHSRARREVREFLADERPDKREPLIDRLLASPRYATHMATTWRNRILPLGVDPARTREALGAAEVAAHAVRQEPALRPPRRRAAAGQRRRRARPRALLPGQRPRRPRSSPAARPSCSWASSCTAPSATTIRSPTGRSAISGASPRSSPA